MLGKPDESDNAHSYNAAYITNDKHTYSTAYTNNRFLQPWYIVIDVICIIFLCINVL